MKTTIYFIQYIFVIIFFSLFKILGLKKSSYLGGKIFEKIGPLFRSKIIIDKNLQKAFPYVDQRKTDLITNMMWNNYGRVFAEYMFIKDFRSKKYSSNIQIEGSEILDNFKKKNQQAVFISGHFANFELMAMHLEKSDIDLCAIYRPLNNIYLNKIMEKIRKSYICKNQIKKGVGGLRDLLNFIKEGYSTALMIDQRVSEGTKSLLFNEKAYTTTIPAQLVKKFNMPVIPIFIERYDDIKFKIKINKPIYFNEQKTIQEITDELNTILEKMIYLKPEQWIWSHNRWK